jgi:hypothetical protein
MKTINGLICVTISNTIPRHAVYLPVVSGCSYGKYKQTAAHGATTCMYRLKPSHPVRQQQCHRFHESDAHLATALKARTPSGIALARATPLIWRFFPALAR